MDSLNDLINTVWDVVVIGTGMGGGTFGYRASVFGKKVLFLEKGKFYSENKKALLHDFVETFVTENASVQLKKNAYENAGRWSDPYLYPGKDKILKFTPFIGTGTGGSSAIYGGAMERFFAEDFTPGQFEHDPKSSIPDHWPLTYTKMEPYYRIAEKMFRVHGSSDPLREKETFEYLAPEKMTDASRELFDFFYNRELNPYRLPVAYDAHEKCKGCQGFLCKYRCKNDSGKICLEPAIKNYGAKLIDQCSVLRLEGDKKTIERVVCIKNGKAFKVRGKIIILSAGAVMSPLILMNSKNKHWPEGLGNKSGLLGKNLMRHHIDLFALFPCATDLPGNAKEIAFNDFYIQNTEKYGTVQSFGALPPSKVLADELEEDLTKKYPWFVSRSFSLVKPIVSPVLNNIFSKSLILASIKEDLPYPDNRVELNEYSSERPLIPILHYTVSDFEKKRIHLFRKLLLKQFKPYKVMVLKQSENIERIAHVCGTCRFGNDPNKSVLDKNNRVHGVENLYVIDASFFPSSGGTNPSLTIAANAVRVADHLFKQENT
jgi:choline dehydrogenase-like flavoprotein